MEETPENNSNIQKPMHGSLGMNNSNIGSSKNPMQNDQLEISNSSFNYLKNNESSTTFQYTGAGIENIYAELKNNCKLVICILAQDDTYSTSDLLRKTLNGIKYNLSGVNNLIETENILICVFFNEIKGNLIFNEEEKYQLNIKLSYILSRKVYIVDDSSPINIHCFWKIDNFTEVEILKFYYSILIKQLKPDNNIIFSIVMKNGVVLNDNSLDSILKVSFFSRQKHSIVVPLLQDQDPKNLFGKIKAYERFHFNIYNMNFYNMTSSVPISSLFNVMTIDDKLSVELYNFYSAIHTSANINYHDYKLSLYLYEYNYKIIYYNDKPMGTIHYPDESENPICNYKKYWLTRYTGYYGNFFNIVNMLVNCSVCNAAKKVFLFFNIIGMMIEFIYPSLSCMVIYTIFFEAFDTHDIRPASFCTMLYLFVVMCNGVNSLITRDSQKTYKSNLVFYFFMEVYYLFIILCSIVAMDNIKKNRNNDPYKFNNAAISCIIIFVFIPSFIPILMNIGKFLDNILPMFLYLFLGAPSSSSNFNICKILNASDSAGGDNIKERKGVYIISFFLINIFFGSLTLYNYTREKRVKAVMGFGILYLIYNFFKMAAIILSLLKKDSEVADVSDSAIKNNLFNNAYQNNYGSGMDNQSNSINNNNNNNNMSNNNEYPSNIDNAYD